MKFIVSIFFIFSVNQALANDYNIKAAKLDSLKEKVKVRTIELKDLIRLKNATRENSEKKAMLNQIETSHKNLLKLISQYSELRRELRFEYPERGDTTERKYLPLRELSLEDVENEAELDVILTRLKIKVDKKYKKFTGANNDKKITRIKEHKEPVVIKKKEQTERLVLER